MQKSADNITQGQVKAILQLRFIYSWVPTTKNLVFFLS
jgi:hypothetical protein